MSGDRIEHAVRRIETALARIATQADCLQIDADRHAALRRAVTDQIAALDILIVDQHR